MSLMKEENKMKKPNVQVLPSENGKKFRVMINFIQHGPEYSSKEIANSQAAQVIAQNLIVH